MPPHPDRVRRHYTVDESPLERLIAREYPNTRPGKLITVSLPKSYAVDDDTGIRIELKAFDDSRKDIVLDSFDVKAMPPELQGCRTPHLGCWIRHP